MKRNETLDIAKGIGILLMLVGHMTGMMPIHKFIYQFHMPLFLLISGYFFNPFKWTSFKDFTIKRCKQLLIPYFVFWCFSAVCGFAFMQEYDFLSVLEWGPKSAIWFLLILFIAEEVFYLIYKYLARTNVKLVVLILLLLALGRVLSSIKLPYSLSAVPICTAFYALGFLLKPYVTKSLQIIGGGAIGCTIAHRIYLTLRLRTVKW